MKTTKRFIVLLAVLGLNAPFLTAGDTQPLWDKYCASCHGKDGAGNTKMGKKLKVKDYRDPKVQDELKDETAIKSIREGILENGKERMAPYKEKLTEPEIKGL